MTTWDEFIGHWMGHTGSSSRGCYMNNLLANPSRKHFFGNGQIRTREMLSLRRRRRECLCHDFIQKVKLYLEEWKFVRYRNCVCSGGTRPDFAVSLQLEGYMETDVVYIKARCPTMRQKGCRKWCKKYSRAARFKNKGRKE